MQLDDKQKAIVDGMANYVRVQWIEHGRQESWLKEKNVVHFKTKKAFLEDFLSKEKHGKTT